MSHYFSIQGSGGRRSLKGKIAVSGAKNAALKGIAASVLMEGPLVFSNVPDIEDVRRMCEIVRTMGAQCAGENGDLILDTTKLKTDLIAPEVAKRLRASIVLTGPVLARFGRARFPHPGGCVIGERPIDLFIESFEKMGALVQKKGKIYDIRAPKSGLRGAHIFFRTPSVTGTETLMMAATLARGRTVIENAAMEPEIAWLADLLNAAGAKIRGAGTPTIIIDGHKGPLKSPKEAVRVIPDRIEAGSFLILGALAAKELTITDVVPEHIGALIELLEYSGVRIERGKTTLTVRPPKANASPRAFSFRTHEYPGLATDLQAPLVVFLTQAKGEGIVFETIFEGRLHYTEALMRMGASVTMMDTHRILVKGPTPLRARVLESPDLRAGLAFVIAASIATGTTEIHEVYNIDRGYEHIEARLKKIGLQITRAAREETKTAQLRH